MSYLSRLENEGGSKSRRNEQVARSEAECQRRNNLHNDCLSNPMIGENGGEGGVPSFFPCLTMVNVNGQIQKAAELLTMWNFLEHKVRIGNTYVIINRKAEPSIM